MAMVHYYLLHIMLLVVIVLAAQAIILPCTNPTLSCLSPSYNRALKHPCVSSTRVTSLVLMTVLAVINALSPSLSMTLRRL